MRFLVISLLISLLAACTPARADPVWSEAALDDLEAVAAAAPGEGLPSEETALAELAEFRRMREVESAAAAQTDVAADALFASLARSFSQGATDPSRADPDWAIPLSPPPDLAALATQREAGALPSALLYPLLPQNAEYAALRDELARLRADSADTAGRDTRIGQVRASLERWRWFPRQLPERRLDVRIAQFELTAIAPDVAPKTYKVIVGTRDDQTPSFVGQIGSLTLNPSWEPPASLAAELLRRFRRDPAAAAREGFEAIDAQGVVHAASTIDWAARPFMYRLRQQPGPANALGRIRFDMADDYAIRLHDTPDRALFNRSERALSHGCIRVETPEDLAVRVIDTETWTLDAVNAEIATGVQQTIALDEILPVYLIYITATANTAGEVAYADDIYRRDGRVLRALDAPDATLARRPDAPPQSCSAGPAMP